MKLRRGCGCPILILLVLDLVLLAGALIGLIRGPSGEAFQATRLGSALSAGLMIANVVACVLLLLIALRGQSGAGLSDETEGGDYDGGTESSDSGEDAGVD